MGTSAWHRLQKTMLASMLVASGLTFGPLGVHPVLASSYTYPCGPSPQGSKLYWKQDVTQQTYWVNEVVSYATVIPLTPCTPNGSYFDAPAVLGANLQYSTSDSQKVVQLGYLRCDSCGGFSPGFSELVYTPSDHASGQPALATWWNQGYGPGVLVAGDMYEFAIAAWSSSRWEYGVRDFGPIAPHGWIYYLTSNTWPVKTGGNVAWWGTENQNWASVMGHRDVDPGFYMNTVEWQQSDNHAWHVMSMTGCYSEASPSYWQCQTPFGNQLDTYTIAH
jgi:hypothetical protein